MLSKKDSEILKGIALILLLIHHLFWKQNGMYDDIHIFGNMYLINQIGIFSKLCVTIFVFLSGYGLMAKAKKDGGIETICLFYLHRFKKLMFNYWFIWLLFVPISYFVFGNTFSKAYPDNTLLHLLTDVFGVHNLLFPNINCYNPTWWFYSCIIVLYLLFPLLYKWTKQKEAHVMILLLSIAISFMPLPSPAIRYYIIAFIVGMWFADAKFTPPTTNLGGDGLHLSLYSFYA